MNNETEKVSPAEEALRVVFRAGPGKVIASRLPWVKDREQFKAWYDAMKPCEPYTAEEGAELIRKLLRSRSWMSFKPESQDFADWIEDRRHEQNHNKQIEKSRANRSATFGDHGDHGEQEGALVILHRIDCGKKLMCFGLLHKAANIWGEMVFVWFPTPRAQRHLMQNRIWYSAYLAPNTIYENTNWKVSFPGGAAPESWTTRGKLSAGEWPEGLKDLYALHGVDVPEEVT